MAQWLRFCTYTEGGMDSIPGSRSKILNVAWHSRKKKKKQLFFPKLIIYLEDKYCLRSFLYTTVLGIMPFLDILNC